VVTPHISRVDLKISGHQEVQRRLVFVMGESEDEGRFSQLAEFVLPRSNLYSELRPTELPIRLAEFGTGLLPRAIRRTGD